MPSSSASYGGQNIFGSWVQLVTRDQSRRKQRNMFAGVDGVESLDHGSSGRISVAIGRHVGSDMSALAALQEAVREYRDGIYRTLIDTRGVTWEYVALESFEPSGKIMWGPTGIRSQKYTMQFEHLI